jgi:hypothetical protein
MNFFLRTTSVSNPFSLSSSVPKFSFDDFFLNILTAYFKKFILILKNREKFIFHALSNETSPEKLF